MWFWIITQERIWIQIVLNEKFVVDFLYNVKPTKASQELLNKGTSNLPVEMMKSIVESRTKVVLLLSKEVSPKSKTLVNFESLCCNIDM